MSRRRLGIAAAVAVAIGGLAAARPAAAQVVIVTAKSATAVINDLSRLAAAGGVDEKAKPALEALKRLKDPEALKGLDRSRPVGAFADFPKQPGQPPSVVIFIPVTDGEAFLKTLEQSGFAVDADAGAPGFSHKVTPPGDGSPSLFALTTAEYAYFSFAPTGAEKLRVLKPAELLPRRAGAGDVTVTACLDRVPGPYKDLFLKQFEQNLAKQREKQPGEDEPRFRGRIAGMQIVQDATTAAIRDGRELALDLGVDPKRDELALELGLTATPGSSLAASLKAFGGRRSLFRGLGKGAVVAAWLNLPMAEPIRDAFVQSLEKSRRDAEEKAKTPAEKELAGKIFEVLKPIFTDDGADLALAIYGPFDRAEGSPTFVIVFGVKNQDGRKLEQVFRDAVREDKPPDKLELKLDMAKAGDGTTSIHRMTIEPMGDNAAALGEPYLFFAFRDDLALVAVGENGLAVLKQALDATRWPPTDPAAQVEFVASISKSPGFAKEADREPMRDAAREVFRGKDAARDHVHLTLRGAEDALRLRLTADVPVLRFFALFSQRLKAKAAANP